MLNINVLNEELIDGVLIRFLKGKVRSGVKRGRMTPWDIRRIDTYTDVLKGIDWSMREECFQNTALWLCEHPNMVSLEDGAIEFTDNAYYEYCDFMDSFMKLQANNDGWVRKDVIRKREDGTKYRTTIYECRKLMFDIPKSEDECKSFFVSLDSKAFKEYLIMETNDVKDCHFMELLSEYRKRWLSEYPNDVRKWTVFMMVTIKLVDMEKVAMLCGKSVSTIYRWLEKVKSFCVDAIQNDRKERAVEQPTGIITNVSVFPDNATFPKCSIKGNTIVKGREIDVVIDGNVYDNPIVTSPRFTNDGCNNHSYSDNYIGWCFDDFISKLEFIDKPIRKKASKGAKYIPKKTVYGQGNDYYHVALPHVRESEIIPLDKWIDSLNDINILSMRDKVRKIAKNR